MLRRVVVTMGSVLSGAVLSAATAAPAAASPTTPQGAQAASAVRAPAPQAVSGPGQPGIDVSHYQGSINWEAVADARIEFAYIKATEGTSYTDPQFRANYTGAATAGMFRGAYHFALPDRSSGTAQARFFLAHGGNGEPDGLTLPPAVDLEYNPYGPDCYGLSPQQMTDWIAAFSATIHRRAERHPVIYTDIGWWRRCTGDNDKLASNHRLWIQNWDRNPGPLPGGWGRYTFWQHTARGQVPGISGHVDRDTFHGPYTRLQALAT